VTRVLQELADAFAARRVAKREVAFRKIPKVGAAVGSRRGHMRVDPFQEAVGEADHHLGHARRIYRYCSTAKALENLRILRRKSAP